MASHQVEPNFGEHCVQRWSSCHSKYTAQSTLHLQVEVDTSTFDMVTFCIVCSLVRYVAQSTPFCSSYKKKSCVLDWSKINFREKTEDEKQVKSIPLQDPAKLVSICPDHSPGPGPVRKIAHWRPHPSRG